jgi:ligand-binding sensor domain-containing protein/serine phosphatase RsbU (regulator of sigma subunit)
VGTGEGLCRFDGKNFKTYSTQDGLAENVITCSYVDESGAQWIGHNGGQITKFDNDAFTIIQSSTNIESKINAINGKHGVIFFVAQNEGVYKIQDNQTTSLGTFGFESFHAVYVFDKDNVIVGTSEGLAHLFNEGGEWKVAKTIFEDEWVNTINPAKNKDIALMGTQSGVMAKIRLKDGKLEKSVWDSKVEIGEISLQFVMEDEQNNIWLATYGQGLIKLKSDTTGKSDFEIIEYNTSTGMASDFVQTVFQDREHNVWIGTFGQGLSTLIDDYFTFYNHESEEVSNNVTSIWIDDSNDWYGVDNGLVRISDQLEEGWTFYSAANGFVSDRVTSLFEMDSVLWIGTAANGVYKYDLASEKFESIKWNYGGLHRRINQITGKDGSIWAATEGGLIVYNINHKSTNLFDTEMGLAHNAIKTVMLGSDGKIWMGTHSRYIYCITNSSIEDYEISSTGELEIVSICEDKDGDIWIATSEKGVYKMINESFSHYTSQEGLKSNYCYSIHPDINNNIWVGHRGALSKIEHETNEIATYDYKSGIKGQINRNGMFMYKSDYLWIGTENGAIKYDPSKDVKNTIPPVINLMKVIVGEKEYPINEDIELPYGISFKNPDEVTYQYMLEGHDEVYSNISAEAIASYGKISDGEYSLKIKACNEDGVCAEKEATINIKVRAPFWKKWWFYLILGIVVIGGVILTVRWRLQRMRKIQEYLEIQLEIKTKEVVEKAEHIEEINKDLTSSISYAQRIQSAILPDTDELTTVLPDSFIFYRPRDIVSGDFYFIRQYKNRLIVGCVDCTGHGVPGAFVSMIGSTTLRNIYMLMETSGNWMTPDDVLEILDSEVQKILHQEHYDELDLEESFFKSRDGMDLTLIEIDLDTKIVQLASAKRHSYIKQDGEIKTITGDKISIGGGDADIKDFSLQTFQMKEGDALYLFSDGYSDQFGGPEGRKLKLSGVLKILNEMQSKENSKHSQHVGDKWDEWKSDHEQIDDVLFMGIQF